MDQIRVPRPPVTNPNDSEHRRQIADSVRIGLNLLDPENHHYGDISGTTTSWASRHRSVVVVTTGASNATMELPNAREAKPGLYTCKNGSGGGASGTITLQAASGDNLDGSAGGSVALAVGDGVVVMHQGSSDWWIVGMYP